MPRTNRRRRGTNGAGAAAEQRQPQKTVHTKRRQIEDDDGWTHIVDAPRKARPQATGNLHAGDFERDGVAYVERTMEELGEDLEYYEKGWTEGEACGGLKQILEKGVEKGEGDERREVNTAVVLGLGSLQSARREGRRASFTQLAALRTILEVLGGEHKLSCVFQDPQFTPLDKEFLSCLGYTVVDDPLAFGHITENSLVYAIHCYAPVYKSVAEVSRPAVIIGTDVDNFGRFNLNETTENIARKLEDMVQDCEVIDFPQVRHDFSDTKLYWRRDKIIKG